MNDNGGSRRMRLLRKLGLRAGPVIAVLVLWLLFVDFPAPPQTWLDASWHAVLVDAKVQGRQFGTEIAFTYGPLGYLNSHFYLPQAIAPKLLWETAGRLALLAGIVALAFRLSRTGRFLSLAGLAAFSGLAQDPVYLVFLTYAFAVGLMRDRTPPWAVAALVLGTAFLSLIKLSFAMLACAGYALLVLHAWLVGGRLRFALSCTGGYLVACLGLWLAARQDLTNIPEFLSLSREISGGYAYAMSFDEPTSVFLAGIATLISALLLCAWAFVKAKASHRLSLMAPTAFCVLAILIAWRHGFTRADAHVLGFFAFCLSLGAALPGMLAPFLRPVWSLLVPAFAILGTAVFDVNIFRDLPGNLTGQITRNAAESGRIATFPERFDAAFEQAVASSGDRELVAIVGNSTIDWISFEQGRLLLSGLSYHPRPVFQGYKVYTPLLTRTNAAFYRSTEAPEFVCVEIQSIDGRYPMQDDSLLLLELARDYEPVRQTTSYTLFRRRAAGPSTEAVRERISEPINGSFGEVISIPDGGGRAIWVRIEARPSALGTIRGALYKPPALRLVLSDVEGSEAAFRLIPGVSEEGFLIQPMIANTDSFLAFAAGEAASRVRSLRIEPSAEADAMYWNDPIISFDLLPEFPLESGSTGQDP
jgi:hypothetical protein